MECFGLGLALFFVIGFDDNRILLGIDDSFER
jgi:hypothetical protein